MTAAAATRGVRLTSRSRPLAAGDFERFEYVIGMDDANIRSILVGGAGKRRVAALPCAPRAARRAPRASARRAGRGRCARLARSRATMCALARRAQTAADFWAKNGSAAVPPPDEARAWRAALRPPLAFQALFLLARWRSASVQAPHGGARRRRRPRLPAPHPQVRARVSLMTSYCEKFKGAREVPE